MLFCRKLRLQLTSEIKKNMPEVDIVVNPQMEPPTDLQVRVNVKNTV